MDGCKVVEVKGERAAAGDAEGSFIFREMSLFSAGKDCDLVCPSLAFRFRPVRFFLLRCF